MKTRMLQILSIISLLIVTGCASNPMSVSSQQELKKPADTQAQVVFMRSSFLGSAISASLYDVTDDQIQFIGVLVNGTKVAYDTSPGKRVFMVVSEAADFMEADLRGGKNYFGLATPRMGAWKARFSLWPIKNDPKAKFHTSSSEFQQWLADTKLVVNTEKSRMWYEKNKASVRAKYETYWPVWKAKSADDLAQRTLSAEDGM